MKHTKKRWLKAAKELRDRYTREAFLGKDASIRRGYCSKDTCAFCKLTLYGDPPPFSSCSDCIYSLALTDGFWSNLNAQTFHRGASCFPCGMIGSKVPDRYSSYAVVARRRTWIDQHIIPWIESLSEKHEFFKKPRKKK